MAQQMVNGSKYEGSTTVTNRMSARYAVVGEPNNGKHKLTEEQVEKRKKRNFAKWQKRMNGDFDGQ